MNELIIDYIPASGENPAKVTVSHRSGQGSERESPETDFLFGMSDDDHELIQWYMEEFLLYPYGGYLDRAEKAEKLIQQKGTELFEAVFSEVEAHDLYVMLRNDIADCRIVVRAMESAGRSLPWEIMRDPKRGYLAQKACAFVRSRPNTSVEALPLDAGDKINILMIISRPGGTSDVRFQSVARPLLEIFRPHRNRINLEILRPPTFERLAGVLAEKPGFYHVIHFDGHGMFVKGTPGIGEYYDGKGAQGVLAFETVEGGVRIVSAKELGELLNTRKVPLVMLNACQSGMTNPEALYPSLGDQLLDTGARGVVAMAYSVRVETAVQFMAKVYGMLVNGVNLDRAVSAARVNLAVENLRSSPVGKKPLQDWPVPVLFQSGEVRLFEPSGDKLELDVGIVKGEQEKGQAEVELPEPPVYGFIGRDSLMLDLETAFRTQTIVLLRGMAGMGKSTAAVGFARWWDETGGVDGPIFFFDFQKYLPLPHICDRVGAVFGRMIKATTGVEWHLLEPEVRKELTLRILSQVPCLMIWDNFETVAGFPTGAKSLWNQEEQDELKGFLRKLMGGRTKVIITSRRDEKWLDRCYRLVEVGGLDMQESSEMAGKVLDRAGVDRKSLKPYDKLLKYLRGNPLAIQVIMPELKRMEPDDLLTALQSGGAKLESDDESLGRTRSLTASLNYRLDHLNPELRGRLGILALFQGFVNAGFLAVICADEDAPPLIKGLDTEAWIAMLESARELGLLMQISEELYRIYPALPWFFRQAMEETFPGQREKLEKIFVRTYGSVGYQLDELFKTNPQMAMILLKLEEPNLNHALRLAWNYEDWDSVQNVLYGLSRLMTMEGRRTEWERMVLDVEADVTDEDGEPLPGCELLWNAVLGHRSEIAEYRRDFKAAAELHERLLKYYEAQAGDEWENRESGELTDQEKNALRNMAVAQRHLGSIFQASRQFDETEELYRRSLAIEKKIGHEQGQSQALHQLGMIAYLREHFDEAEDWYSRSLKIEKKIGNEQGLAKTLHQLGNIAYVRKHFDDAEKWYRGSLEIEEKIGDEYSQAATLNNLGAIAQGLRQFGEAENWYRKSLAIREKIGDEHGQAQTLQNLGVIAMIRKQFDEAEAFYRKAEEIFERMNDPHSLGIVRNSLEILKKARGDGD